MILSEESILLNNNERQKFFSNLIEEIGKEQLSFSEQRLMRRISVYFNQLIDTTSFGFKK
jgi:DNA-directed RNA polymerase delta subunit